MSWHGAVLFYNNETDGEQDTAERDGTVHEHLSTFVIDHIVRNCNTQDLWAAAMILEEIIARVTIQLPDCDGIWLVSDNARTYQNDVMSEMVPLIGQEHGLRLRGCIQPETARGKSLVDDHLAIEMRQVHRYVKETQKDVTTPEDVVRAMQHDSGVVNCAVELVSVHRDGGVLQQWRDGVRGRHIMPLRRIGEFK